MEHFVFKDENELTHWGVRGMRWGIRRYQNKDGSLTKAGQQRYKDELAAVRTQEKTLKNRKAVQTKMDKLAARKKAVEEDKKKFDEEQKKAKEASKNPKKAAKEAEKAAKEAEKAAKKEAEKAAKKSIKEMGDEELAYKIRRTQMEKQYEALVAEPEPAAKGDGFVKDFMNKSAVPAVQEAGKTLIRDSLLKAGRKYLGLENDVQVKTVDKLKEEYDKLNYADKINTLKNKAAKAAEKERAKQAAEEAKQEAKAAAKEAAKQEKTSEKKTYSVDDVEVIIDSRSTSSREGKKWANNSPVHDVEYTEVVSSNNTSSGRNYVSNYLALPASRDDK